MVVQRPRVRQRSGLGSNPLQVDVGEDDGQSGRADPSGVDFRIGNVTQERGLAGPACAKNPLGTQLGPVEILEERVYLHSPSVESIDGLDRWADQIGAAGLVLISSHDDLASSDLGLPQYPEPH